MIIGIDGNEANVEKPVGVSVYTKMMLEHFHKQKSSNLQFRIFLRNHPLPHLPQNDQYFSYKRLIPPLLWSQIALPTSLYFQKDLDVFFSPAHYSPFFLQQPSVVTIHDLSYFYYPHEFLKYDLYKLTHWTKRSVQKAKHIICVSKTTKRDLIKFYDADKSKISVVYNGFEKPNLGKKRPKNLPIKNNSYILYVGTIQPRKNLKLLIEAYALFRKTHAEISLVIAGKKGWLYDEVFKISYTLGISESVLFPEFVSDEELIWLYENALCLVHPSLYEGFGIPLLEAMSYACPVISSNAASLPEIGGDACLYFDPDNKEELVENLEKITRDTKLRDELIKNGKKRIKNFSWKKSAEQTLNIIKNAVVAI